MPLKDFERKTKEAIAELRVAKSKEAIMVHHDSKPSKGLLFALCED